MRFSFGMGTALAAVLALGSTPSLASSHREAPGITKMPKVDNTDVYAFRSYEPGRADFVTLIANFQPDQSPGNGPNYYTMDPDAIYEIHVDNNGDGNEDTTFQFKFNNTLRNGVGILVNAGGKALPLATRTVPQIGSPDSSTIGEVEDYTLTVIQGDRRSGQRNAVVNVGNGVSIFRKPIDNVGQKTIPNYAAYASQFVYNVVFPGCSTNGKVFVGQRAEAFAVAVGDIFDGVNLVPIEGDSAPGAGDRKGFPGGRTQNRANDDLVGKKNVTTLAVEVPIGCLIGSGNGVLGVWSSASLPQSRLLSPTPTYASPAAQSGAFVQVSRLGQPLVNELIFGMPVKDLFNAVTPKSDAALIDYVTNPTFPVILDALFRAPVNATLGTNFANLAPQNYPRTDLVTTFLTGINGLNIQSLSVANPGEVLRLNTRVSPTPRDSQNTFGVVGDDLAGYPNGRRPGDDAVDITLRVAMGRLCYPIPIAGKPTDLGLCKPADAPTGLVAYTDGAPISARELQNVFPYLNNPLPGSPRSARPGG